MANSFQARNILILLVALFGIGFMVFSEVQLEKKQNSRDIVFEKDRLSIITQEGLKYDFEIELAQTSEQKSQGLMFRKSLMPNAGMLFTYPYKHNITMWMKNTFIPLDMIFIDQTGTIINIHKNAQPQSTQVISSSKPALAALELNAHTCDKLGIRPGDKIIHKIFD